ncbi:leucine-rich repeat neuronal protein 1-like [Elysia marginata]|uniref:Leucine-rich repeat neuronal protein 1-like n=1 Tax=Elysia marginata TaxID=1093978 RepID=A0AAV4F2D2_9GAST|nr:leucine-rich repeat neuronal protein 1-like [Elysia marginata]
MGASCKSTEASSELTVHLSVFSIGSSQASRRGHVVRMFAAAVSVLLCCLLGQGAAAPTSTEQQLDMVYRLRCPELCECRHSGGHVGPVSSVDCSSSRASLLQVYPSVVLYNTTGNHTLNTTTAAASLEPRLELLDLSHNNLTSVAPADIFQADLQQLSGLTLLTPVLALNASHNAIPTLHDTSFENYAGLLSLDLSNNAIHCVSERAFDGLESLQRLDLSHNNISALEDTLFYSLVNLLSLDLSHNQIEVVYNLHALSSLRYLYLQHNNLHATKPAQPSLLPPMLNLSYLDLSDNPLGMSRPGMFKTVPALTSLDISRCSISQVDSHFLQGLSLLRQLRLDENNLAAITSPVFENTSLISLSVASMPNLVNLSHNAFQGLSQLVSLNLSHNTELSFVNPYLLSPLSQLEQLDLSHCSISLLSQITFHYNGRLKEVYLRSNSLACSCVNAWLAKEAGTSPFKDLTAVSCVNITSPQAQPIVSASFQCEEISLHNVSSPVSVHLGGQALLKCGHSSAGQPHLVRWTTPAGKVFLQHDFHPQANSHLLTEQDIQPGADYHKGHYWRGSSSYFPDLFTKEDRVLILADGSLYIDYMLRTDTGPYICQVSNAHHNQSATVVLLLDYKISGEIQIFAIIFGLLCALGFFTLNLIYVIISWIARRLVNKRRREIIRQMLENINAYKSTQITRIHENYTHQLGRVRNQYHMQRDRLHRNYTQQVAKMKRGCSNQVEKVRDNYTSRLAQLRDYSSNQVVQIRERANNQIVRIRDYGTSQLEKLRETYKLQHLHVMKLLDTMNLDNCRHIVETECMRAESMMFDVDLLGDDMRTDSPLSGVDSEYTTPDTSPASSLDEKAPQGLSEDMAQNQQKQARKKILHPARHSPPILMEMQTTLTSQEGGLTLDLTDQWEYSGQSADDTDSHHTYLMNLYIPSQDSQSETILQLQSEPHGDRGDYFKENFPLPTLFMEDEAHTNNAGTFTDKEQSGTADSPFMTPEASPTKKLFKPSLEVEQTRETQGLKTDTSDNETDL